MQSSGIGIGWLLANLSNSENFGGDGDLLSSSSFGFVSEFVFVSVCGDNADCV
jgi:hypothetical protein